MSAYDDEFPAPPSGSRSTRSTASIDFSGREARIDFDEPSSILKVPFGIDVDVLVAELRQLANAVEAKEVFPQELVRTQRDLIDDFKMFTLAVTFASPSHPPSELQS